MWCFQCSNVRVMWMRLRLHMQNRSLRLLSFQRKICIVWYHTNSMVIFMPEVKSFFFQGVQRSLKNMLMGPKSYLWYAVVVKKIFNQKCMLGATATDLFLDTIDFQSLLYNQGKIVLAEENLTTPSCSRYHCSPGYVESLKIKWKNVFFIASYTFYILCIFF